MLRSRMLIWRMTRSRSRWNKVSCFESLHFFKRIPNPNWLCATIFYSRLESKALKILLWNPKQSPSTRVVGGGMYPNYKKCSNRTEISYVAPVMLSISCMTELRLETLDTPSIMPEEMARIMYKCWQFDPSDRPGFSTIKVAHSEFAAVVLLITNYSSSFCLMLNFRNT